MLGDLSPENVGARCEACAAYATWAAGTPAKARENPALHRQRFLCRPDSAAWGRFFDDRRIALVRSGTRINARKWQAAFDEFLAQRRGF